MRADRLKGWGFNFQNFGDSCKAIAEIHNYKRLLVEIFNLHAVEVSFLVKFWFVAAEAREYFIENMIYIIYDELNLIMHSDGGRLRGVKLREIASNEFANETWIGFASFRLTSRFARGGWKWKGRSEDGVDTRVKGCERD